MSVVSIPERLQELATVNNVGVQFLDQKGNLRRFSYAELIKEARRFADGLRYKGVKWGDPVILIVTEPQSAIIAILGCMIAGCPPTPIYPPQNLQGVPAFLSFIRHVTEKSGATFVIADNQPFAFLGNVVRESPTIRGVEKFANITGRVTSDTPGEINPIAFLQFTSGSTSTPKGVMVMQEGLTANLEMIRQSCFMDQNSCVVTWLPVYHDMGLIGTVLNAITLPCNLVVLPPLVFLKHPRMWLELISKFRGTHTAAPNFAYGLCVKRVADTSGLDLGSMTTFICGAEPVLPKTMENFAQHYAKAGLRSGAMVPAYGLAEATLAVTFSPFMRGLLSEEVDVEALTDQRIANTENGNASLRVSSCGLPLNGLNVRIASEDGTLLKDREVGEIQISGICVTPGYIGDPNATAASKTSDGWLRTGDLGYMANGELYPCGRMKDVIIIRGKNFHAHDLESVASEVPGVRTGNVVAFGIQESSGESLVLIAETKKENDSQEIRRQIRTHLAEAIGITPDEVVVVPPGTLPKTSSGKLKRNETKSLFQAGELGAQNGKMAGLGEIVKSRLGFLRNRLQ